MPPVSEIRKVAFLGDYLPRKCGIATFTTDLRCAIAEEFPALQCLVVPVNDRADGYDYPAEVRFEIAEQDLPSYLRAHEEVGKLYADTSAWMTKAIRNVARSGKFSSDRTIREYAEGIWGLRPVP